MGNVEITELGSSPRLPKNDQSRNQFQRNVKTSYPPLKSEPTYMYTHIYTAYQNTQHNQSLMLHSNFYLKPRHHTLLNWHHNYRLKLRNLTQVDTPSNKIMQPSINVLSNPKSVNPWSQRKSRHAKIKLTSTYCPRRFSQTILNDHLT